MTKSNGISQRWLPKTYADPAQGDEHVYDPEHAMETVPSWNTTGAMVDTLLEGTVSVPHSLSSGHFQTHEAIQAEVRAQMKLALEMATNQATEVVLGRSCRFLTRSVSNANAVRILGENPDRRMVKVWVDATLAGTIYVSNNGDIAGGGFGAVSLTGAAGSTSAPFVHEWPHRGELWAQASAAGPFSLYIVEVLAN